MRNHDLISHPRGAAAVCAEVDNQHYKAYVELLLQKKGCTNRAMKRALKIFLEFLPVGIIMRKEIIVVMEKVFAVQIHFNKLLYGVACYCVQFLFSCENIV